MTLTDRFDRLHGWRYRLVMRIAHRFNWHYAPPIYPEGDMQLWCKWCGFRMTIARHVKHPAGPETLPMAATYRARTDR